MNYESLAFGVFPLFFFVRAHAFEGNSEEGTHIRCVTGSVLEFWNSHSPGTFASATQSPAAYAKRGGSTSAICFFQRIPGSTPALCRTHCFSAEPKLLRTGCCNQAAAKLIGAGYRRSTANWAVWFRNRCIDGQQSQANSSGKFTWRMELSSRSGEWRTKAGGSPSADTHLGDLYAESGQT